MPSPTVQHPAARRLLMDGGPLLEALLASLTLGVVLADARADDQPIVYVNRGFEQLTGYGADEALGRNCRFLQGESADPTTRARLRDAIAAGEPVSAVLLNHRRDGSPFWNQMRLTPVGGEPGRPELYLGLLSDVSAVTFSGTAAEAAPELIRSVFGTMHEGVLVIGVDGLIAEANPAAEAILGVSREVLFSEDWYDRLAFRLPSGRPLTTDESYGRHAMNTGQRLLGKSLTSLRSDGRRIWLSLDYEPLRGPDGGIRGIVVSFRDVTEQRRHEEQARLFAALVELSSDFIAMSSVDGELLFLNEAGLRLVGLDSLEEARALPLRSYLSDAAWEQRRTVELPAILAAGRWEGESTLRHQGSGELIDVRVSSYLVRHHETRDPIAIATVRRDITGEKQAQADLLASRDRFERQFRGLPVPTFAWRRCGDDFVLADSNDAGRRVLGERIDDLIGRSAAEVMRDHPELRLALERCHVVGASSRMEAQVPWRAGEAPRDLVLTFVPVPPDTVLVHMRDITRQLEDERRLRELAERDGLTGLHNRRHFEECLVGRDSGAVITVDIDHFKFVNDSLGHAAGDELLRACATLLTAHVREGDIVARLGGDEFAVLLDQADPERAAAVARHLLAAIRDRSTALGVTASAGVALFAPGDEPGDAMIAADLALYQAKQHGRDRFEVYGGERGASLTWLDRIRAAIDEDRLELHAQPVLDLAGGGTEHEELLVRMRDERGEIVLPGSFLPTAEQFGVVRDIDRWVVTAGVARAATGRSVAINLSARSLSDLDLPAWIGEQIAAAGVDPSRLTFEYTETAAVSNIDDARQFTERLNAIGCRVALDDFGTGFGSFVLLKHLPVGIIKIDMEFVRELSTSESDRRIVQSIVDIARRGGLRTVAEGVEDEGALALLREYGVDAAQGFHIGRPAPID